MSKAAEKKVKASVIKLLKSKKIYEKDIDDQKIDEYIFNLILIQEAKANIARRGVMVQMGKDPNFEQQNFAIGIYHNAIKSNNTILKQLGLEKTKIEMDIDDRDAINKLNEFLNGK